MAWNYGMGEGNNRKISYHYLLIQLGLIERENIDVKKVKEDALKKAKRIVWFDKKRMKNNGI